MHSIRYHCEFARELASVNRWYEMQREGLGGEFIECVEAAIREIAEYPRRSKRINKASSEL